MWNRYKKSEKYWGKKNQRWIYEFGVQNPLIKWINYKKKILIKNKKLQKNLKTTVIWLQKGELICVEQEY